MLALVLVRVLAPVLVRVLALVLVRVLALVLTRVLALVLVRVVAWLLVHVLVLEAYAHEAGRCQAARVQARELALPYGPAVHRP